VDNQAPWSLKKTDPVRMEEVLYVVAILIIKSSILLLPIIPSSIKKVLSIFSLSVEEINLSKIQNFLPEIISIKKPYPIFPRIEK
jgi:methionyl-tRNA synthetase